MSPRAPRLAHLLLQLVHLLQHPHQAHRLGERERLVAGQLEACTRARTGSHRFQVHRQLGQVHAQPVVADQLIHHAAQLLALLRRHAVHHRLHRGLLALHLLDQIIQRIDAGTEVVAILLHEAVEVRLFALGPLAQHLVELAHHLAHARQVFGRHVLNRLLHALEVLLHDLLLEHLQQLLELLPRLLVHEVIVGELANLPGRDPCGNSSRYWSLRLAIVLQHAP